MPSLLLHTNIEVVKGDDVKMISAHRLIFNGFSTEDFDVIPYLSFDSDDGATPTFLNLESINTEHYDGHRTIHRGKYSEVFTPRFTLIKKDESDFDATENRKILSWLTASDKPGFLEVYSDDSNVLEWKVFGCITSIEQYKLGNGRIVGYEFEMESTHPYAWSRKFTYPEVYAEITEISNNDEDNDYLTVSGVKSIDITCNSDEYNQLLFPQVTITFDEGDIYFPVDTDPMVSDYIMIPNVIYRYNSKYYVNTNDGKVEVITNVTRAPAGSSLVGKYYYFDKDKTIEKVVVNDTSYEWKIVSHVGAAVKIDNSYTLNGKTVPKEVIVAGGALGETIILNGANKIIHSTTNNQLNIIGDDFNWEWPSFVAGTNILTITGKCKIKFEWLEPRKVGSL